MRDYKDIIGGGGLVLFGGAAAINAAMTLNLGTLTRLGPGLFPAAVGVIVAGLGVGILVPALSREGAVPKVELRPLLAIVAAVVVFGLLIRPFGLVPAILASTVLAGLAGRGTGPIRLAIIAVALAVACAAIFVLGLRVQLTLFSWPW